jgi:L-lactate dehydrogenase complex protein LldG
MGTREEILDRVRRNAPPAVEKPEVPDFCRLGHSDLISAFKQSLGIMAGTLVESPPQDFAEFLRKQFPHANNICSNIPEYTGNTWPESYSTTWSDAARIDVTVVRSPLGIAETGSVLLSEVELHVNTIGFLAHDIVILLDPKRIVENVHLAYQHPAMRERAYFVLMSGPSGSADIGGKEVHPAQGVMTLTVILWPEQAKS